MKKFLLSSVIASCLTFSQSVIACSFCKSQPSSKPSVPLNLQSTTSGESGGVTTGAPLGKTIAAVDSAQTFFANPVPQAAPREVQRQMRDTFSVSGGYQSE